MAYRILKIELTFENTESVVIDGEHIEDIGMVEVTDIINIKANEVHVTDNVECMFLKISEEANQEYVNKNINEKSTVFDRIMKYRDICAVTVYLEDVSNKRITERYYTVPWEGQYDEDMRQRVVFEGGSLTVYLD